MRWGLCAAFALLASAGLARANDSTAELTTGGLVLTKTADVEMRAEDLSISETMVAVRYVFFNRSAADVTATIAFPMPDIVWDGLDNTIAVPDPEAANFLDFHVAADGAEVATRLEQKALKGEADITARLQALRVPLAPQSEATGKALDALPKAAQDDLVKAGVATPDDFDAGKGMEHHLAPQWTLKSTFFWKQTFPAGREIVVEHRYKPSLGSSAGSMFNARNLDAPENKDYLARYCVDRDFRSSLNAAIGKRDADGYALKPFSEKRLAYVLKTGANWAGPIGDFHLTIDKGDPAALVSFCEDGVKKTGPTRFEVRHKNFTPARDLNILILYRPQP